MDSIEPSAQPLLNIDSDATNGRLNIRLQEIHVSSAPASIASSDVSKPPKATLDVERSLRTSRFPAKLLDVLHRITKTVASPWKACVRTGKKVWTKSWTLETCSYIISTLALAGLVTTLLAHQNKPLPQWPQLVTINSILSLFSLLIRACVGVVLAEGISQSKWNWYHKPNRLDHIDRIDSASRGSWGAITLLYHFRPESAYYLAAFGAVVTIMASLTGFFVQQLVQFKDCYDKDATTVASLSKGNEYDRVGGFLQTDVPAAYAPMVAAITVSMLQPVTNFTNVYLSSGCDSGNCSFPNTDGAAFSTLAITHFCENSTAHIRTINETTYENWTQGYSAFDYGDNKSWVWDMTNDGLILKSLYENWSMHFIYRSHWSSNLSFGGKFEWKAINCSLFPTVNTYGASINNTKLEEKLEDVIPLQLVSTQFQQPHVSDPDLFSQDRDWSYRMATNDTVRNDDNLKSILKDQEISKALASGRDEIAGSEHILYGIAGSEYVLQLYLSGNMTFDTVNERIGALATSMTAVIRTHGGNGYTTFPQSVNGDVWTRTTCMYIRWPWITFPTVMVGLTGVFLLLAVFENRGIKKDRLWKSSFLAALFCEVEMPSRPMGKAEMKSNAKSTSSDV
ncbi:hypothetical protein E8E13_000457 [Curvularia kusanoi]|uniref:DUF3176 domain containing protein n=1 Tax=Curvularia kusanoi TaxID=90978 RepID=A0A9P4T5L7_CURKU|nr:hypothetical protein E8E13_000457 [Curvularia kusanoi]